MCLIDSALIDGISIINTPIQPKAAAPSAESASTAAGVAPRRRTLLILPCYNEAASIAAVLLEISVHLGPDYDALVIDDASTDSTADIARRAGAACVRLVKNLGIGGAVQTGIKYARAHMYDFCVQIDGDGQHPAAQVARLFEAYDRRPANIVVGSRYLTQDTFRSTWTRRLGGRVISSALRLFFRQSISDPTSGLRLLDRKAIEIFSRTYPRDFPEPISLAWAYRAGLSVSETAVEMRDREHGQSSITGWKPVAYMLRVLGYILLIRLHMKATV